MTFDELKACVRDLTNRTDLDASLPMMVQMAEEEFRGLRVRQMVTRATLTVTGPWANLPANFLAERSATAEGKPLIFVTLEALEAHWNGETGTPEIYTVDAGRLRFYPEPVTPCAIEFTYYAKPVPFTEGQGNWISAEFPNAYRYGVMLMSSLKTRDTEAIPLYRGLLDRTLSDLQARNRDRTGRPLRADASLMQPSRSETWR